MKIGSIVQWTSNTIPDGFLLCDGSAVSRTIYTDLFSVIGTTYGAGDGSTTFNVPDYRGRVGVGLDSNDTDFDTLGEIRGEKTHTLTIDEMPAHRHDIQPLDNQDWRVGDSTGIGGQHSYPNVIDTQPILKQPHNSTLYTTTTVGGGQPHNIIQPSIVTNYIIKALNPDTIKISELESANNITGSDVLPIVQNGETKKITTETLLADIYSTNELKTNKVWIDGKPIYRKVFTGNMLSSSSGQYWSNLFKTNLPIETLVNIDGIIQNTLTDYRAIKVNTIESDDYYCIVSYLQSTDYVQTRVSGWLYPDMGFVYRIVLEYTKTTN